ncbi:16599_t:CDS:2, partial [Racocetra persica]
ISVKENIPPPLICGNFITAELDIIKFWKELPNAKIAFSLPEESDLEDLKHYSIIENNQLFIRRCLFTCSYLIQSMKVVKKGDPAKSGCAIAERINDPINWPGFTKFFMPIWDQEEIITLWALQYKNIRNYKNEEFTFSLLETLLEKWGPILRLVLLKLDDNTYQKGDVKDLGNQITGGPHSISHPRYMEEPIINGQTQCTEQTLVSCTAVKARHTVSESIEET